MTSTIAHNDIDGADDEQLTEAALPPKLTSDVVLPNPRAAHYGLWALQALVAGIFLVLGLSKLVLPAQELAAVFGWAAGFPTSFARVLGVCEVAGALGLLLPAATRIAPILTPVAAACLCVLMIMASLMHFIRYEFALLPFTVALGGACALIAWGRYARSPIAPRSTHLLRRMRALPPSLLRREPV